MGRWVARIMVLAVSAGGWAGCAHYPVNGPIDRGGSSRGEYRFGNFRADEEGGNSEDLFVVVALSGGGGRAAAFSYGLLEALRDTRIVWRGKEKSLLSEVDVMTSVSGSSFTAAYYGWRGEKIFEEFPQKFLYRDLESEVVGSFFLPWNWPRLMSPTFDRVDLAAEAYEKEVFAGATLGDLTKAGRRPYVVLNASDVSLGSRFEFTQEQFDFLGSDVGTVRLGRAVAASSAFPVVLSPLAMENYPKKDFAEPAWVGKAIAAGAEAEGGIRVARRAMELRSYEDTANRKHVRLLDGAIADYTGLRGPLQWMLTRDGDVSIKRLVEEGKIKKLVIISLNAVRTVPIVWDKEETAPGWYDMLYFTASAPIRNNAFETVMVLQNVIRENKAAWEARGCETDLITVNFDGVKDAQLRARLEVTKTSLSLKKEQVDDLRRGAGEALRESKGFAELMREIGVRGQK